MATGATKPTLTIARPDAAVHAAVAAVAKPRARCTCGHTRAQHMPHPVTGTPASVCVGGEGACPCGHFAHGASTPRPHAARGPGHAARARASVVPATLHDLLALGGGDHTERLRKALWAWRAPGAPKPGIVAFDLATRGGWATLDRHGGFKCGQLQAGPGATITMAWVEQVRDVLRDAYAGAWSPVLVVVEDTFIMPGFAGGTMTALARLVGAVLVGTAQSNMPACRVMAASWQGAMLGKREKDPATGRTRARGKEVSLQRARALFGADAIVDDNVADAALLCRWAWGEW